MRSRFGVGDECRSEVTFNGSQCRKSLSRCGLSMALQYPCSECRNDVGSTHFVWGLKSSEGKGGNYASVRRTQMRSELGRTWKLQW